MRNKTNCLAIIFVFQLFIFATATANRAAIAADPAAISVSSYVNTKETGITSDDFPQDPQSQKDTLLSDATAFFRYPDGTIGLVASRLMSWPRNTASAAEAKPAMLYFFKKVNGRWVNNSSIISERSVPFCVHPRKAIPADYNNDGVIDFVIACHGFDAPPFAGERSRVILSQPDGKYRMDYFSKTVEFQHAGAAHDFNGDGYADVIMTKSWGVDVFLNDGTGHFNISSDYSVPQIRRAFHIELLDLNSDGKFDIVVGSHEWEDATRIIFNPGNNKFGGSIFNRPRSMTLPAVPGAGTIVDFVHVKSNNSLYTLRTGDGQSTGTIYYKGMWLQKFNIATAVSTIEYANKEWKDSRISHPSYWMRWMIERDGSITSDWGNALKIPIQ